MPLPPTHYKFLSALTAIVFVALAGCAKTPDGIDVVSNFELERYLGTWYEIARLDHRFERDLTNVTATYNLREDGSVAVINRGYDTDEKQWKDAKGKAYFVGDDNVGSLKVSFFGPFYGGYNVIALDQEKYEWSMVAGPNRSYLWILARQPDLDPSTLDRLVSKAAELGFDTEALIYVPHGNQR